MQSQSISNLTNGTQLILQNVHRLRFWVTLERVKKNSEKKKKTQEMSGKVLSAQPWKSVDY